MSGHQLMVAEAGVLKKDALKLIVDAVVKLLQAGL
jgi:hypothetical protein